MGAAPSPPPPPPPRPEDTWPAPPPPPPPRSTPPPAEKPPRQLPPVRRPGIDPEPGRTVDERPPLNLVLLAARALGMLQGFLGIIGGVSVLGIDSGAGALSHAGGADTGMLIDSLVIILIATAVINASILVALPSRIARWFMIVFEVLAAILTIGIAAHLSVLLDTRDLYLVADNVSGTDFIHPLLALAIELAIIYALLFNRATRAMFVRGRPR